MSSNEHERVIIHLDIDAFYAQVEEVAQPELKSKPLGVYQKTIIVTCNYVAREYGIQKCMLTTEAIKLCPNLVLVNGENLEKYRQVSQDITRFIQDNYKVPVEKLGFDENFVDVSKLVNKKISSSGNSCELEDIKHEEDFTLNPVEKELITGKRKSEDLNSNEALTKKYKSNSFASELPMFSCFKTDSVVENRSNCDVENISSKLVGHIYNNTTEGCSCGCIERICIGTHIANTIRLDIFKTFSLTMSAGISFNKLLAKLVSSLHKPNQQTVIFPDSVFHLMSSVKLRQIPGIGSKMFDKLASIGINTVEDLQSASKVNLCKVFDSTTTEWLSNISYGRDSCKVKVFCKQSSIGVEDRYYKPIDQLTTFKSETQVLLKRLLKLVKKDGRVPRLMKISLRFDHFKYVFKLLSKQCQINLNVFYNHDECAIEKYLLDVAVRMYKELCEKKNSNIITYINIALSNFIEVADSQNGILKFCQKESSSSSSKTTAATRSNACVQQVSQASPSDSSNMAVQAECQQSNSLLAFNVTFSNNTPEHKHQECKNTEKPVPSFSNVATLASNLDNIDRDVLNELPNDIRKEIELELKRHHLNRSSSEGNIRRINTMTNTKKKPSVRQLSMLNFLEKK